MFNNVFLATYQLYISEFHTLIHHHDAINSTELQLYISKNKAETISRRKNNKKLYFINVNTLFKQKRVWDTPWPWTKIP